MLPPGSAEPGPWRQERFPYWRVITQAAVDPATRQLDVICGTQTSKTESMINIALHRLDDGPRVPVLLFEPTQRLARSVANRVNQAIESTSRLRELLARGRANKTTEKLVAGIRFGIHWSGSKVELASHPAGLVILDELDRNPGDIDREGDLVTLARGRGKSYRRFLLVTTTTPTTEGVSLAWPLWLEGSREVWEWRCPGCKLFFFPRSDLVKWPADATPEEAKVAGGLCCPHCDRRVSDEERWEEACVPGRFWRYRVRRTGELVAEGEPPASAEHRSFWITGCSSPWANLAYMTAELCAAHRSGDPFRLQATVNTSWGEWYRGSGDRPEPSRVREHLGGHRRGQAPDWVLGLTLGVDVQKDRLEWHLLGVGPDWRRASVEWGVLYGSPEHDDVWLALNRLRERTYGRLAIARCFVDSGYQPGFDAYRRPVHAVYAYTARTGGWAWPTKGVAGGQPMPVRESGADIPGTRLWLVSADYWKSQLYGELRGDEQRVTFPVDVTDDLCEQLTSEELVRLPTGRLVWRLLRGRANHQLDAYLLATAAAWSLNWHVAPPFPGAARPRSRIVMDPNLRS